MAIPAADGMASFDQTPTAKLDLSDVLATIILADTFLLGALPFQGMATQVTHSFFPDQLNAPNAVQSGGDQLLVASGGGGIEVSQADGNRISVGALLKDEAAAQQEVIQVTSIAAGSPATLTVTRAYGSTTAQDHAALATWRIISQPKQENDKSKQDISRQRSGQVDNYTQIFKKEVEISGTKQALETYGVKNEAAKQIHDRTLELKRELGMTIYHGIGAGPGSDAVMRTMKGLREFLTQVDVGGGVGVAVADTVYDDTVEALTDVVTNDMYKACWDEGGDPTVGVGARQQITKFATLYDDQVRLAQSDRMRGLFVEKYLTDMGREITLLTDRWVSIDEFAILDTPRIAVMPLIGRNWQMSPLAVDGDGLSSMIVGEFTMEVRNAGQAHAIHTLLTV